MEESLKLDFGIPKPKIALLGINPHTGDNGVIGNEDDEVLPENKRAERKGKLVYGPYAADGFGTPTTATFRRNFGFYHDHKV